MWSHSKEGGSTGATGAHQSLDSSNPHIPPAAQTTRRSGEQFKLTVSARFKPRNLADEGHHTGTPSWRKNITLPLHQRLALIRMNRNITCQRTAFKVLMDQGGWFGGDCLEDDAAEQRGEKEESSVHVEGDSNKHPTITGGVHYIDTVHNAAILVDRTKGLRRFEFDHVFCDQSTQESIYQKSVMPLVMDFINGYNATCFVYGQTGSGKTYSMFGPHVYDDDNDDDFGFQRLMLKENDGIHVPESMGIVPRALKEVFDAVQYRNSNLSLCIRAQISLSYIEIYGDEISDLLRKGAPCGQSRVAAQRYVLDGSSEIHVHSLQEALELLDRGEKQKRKASTALNARSSRAHTLFIVTLHQQCEQTGISAKSQLYLVDLGGSEQIKKSQPYEPSCQSDYCASSTHKQKQRVQEAIHINLGLLALKQCVEALVKNRKHVPYADSKLTMMLSAGLGGDCKTSLIVCGAQEEVHGSETIAAMNFGQTCRGITNSAQTNINMLQNLLRSIDEQISKCEMKIRENERWDEVDDEILDEHGNLIEIRKKTIVCGADSYRRELAELLRQKAELVGENVDAQIYSNSQAKVKCFGDFHQYTS